METYGCSRVNNRDIPRWVLRRIKRLGLNPPLKVPIRQNGMTSTGKPLMCHPNVEQLVRKYGGERSSWMACCLGGLQNQKSRW